MASNYDIPRRRMGCRGGDVLDENTDVKIDGAFPSHVLHRILESLTAGVDPGEPPIKRRKIEPSSLTSICVVKEEVLISRERDPESDIVLLPETELDLKRIDFHFHMSQRGLAPCLCLVPRGHNVARLFLADHEVSREAAVICGMSRDDRFRVSHHGKPGFWRPEMSLFLSQDEHNVCLKAVFKLCCNLTRSPYDSWPQPKYMREIQSRLDDLLNLPDVTEDSWSPMDFYDAAFVPPKEDIIAASIVIPRLEATLYPYQKRSLRWMLGREGTQCGEAQDQALSRKDRPAEVTSLFFNKLKDAEGDGIYLSKAFATVATDLGEFQRAETVVRGGILAEEMGLGKTLEIISLVLLHQRCNSPTQIEPVPAGLMPSDATLIVAPESLRQQWLSEIARHAPSLRVKDYLGCRRSEQLGDDIQMLSSYDIVITTYRVLANELHFAKEAPERSRRRERKYERPVSPLVKISWWRLCLDEAQMIENGFSQAAQVAHVIPRVNAWGITGTPVKDNVDDLYGLLAFIKYAPFWYNKNTWQSLLSGRCKEPFRRLFGSIALRHTKASVRDELKLPSQKRYVISVPFTAVEQQHYQSMYRLMAEECNLDLNGGPLTEDWDPDDHAESMRSWLNRLRQAVLHPEIGAQNRRALGRNKSKPLRTVDEVLEAMLEQSEATLRTETRNYLNSKLSRGQLYENTPRVGIALQLWDEVRSEARQLVEEARKRFDAAIDSLPNGRDHGEDADISSDESDDESDLKNNITEPRRRLRDSLELLHKAVFFCANAHFQLRDNSDLTPADSDEALRLKEKEEEEYEEAKVLRREILRESHRKATRAMLSLARKAQEQSFAEIPELVVSPTKGIETRAIVDDMEELCGRLNEQANVLDEWREQVVQLLLKPLVDEDDETAEFTGEELGESAKLQDELMVYVAALRAALADRSDAITGQENLLIRDEVRRSAKLAEEGNGPHPEKLLALLDIRSKIDPRVPGVSMRGTISKLRGLSGRDTGASRSSEQSIAEMHLKATLDFMSKQNRAAMLLEAEIEVFRTSMNARLEFYRQLQAVSDSVLPYEGTVDTTIETAMKKREQSLETKLTSMQAKHRYLENLKETGTKSNEPRICVICQMAFTTGVLTVCGHQFCSECIRMWLRQKHNCPTCKLPLTAASLHDITMKPQALKLHSEGAEANDFEDRNSPSKKRLDPNGKSSSIYSEFNAEKLLEIKNVELNGPSFTTKVDTLVQHLIWLRTADPGAKSIIFSQYKDFLSILRVAFTRFRIGFSSIDDNKGIMKFKDDPSVEVFLLHARAHSSGLNLVNASHVFLCEPLLNTALELQAIARVDRIGQTHDTTVWLYLVSGTVEECIHDLSVKRRMQHLQRSKQKGKMRESTPDKVLDANLEEANTLEMEHAKLSKLMSKDKSAGEMVAQNDLWECLFGSGMREGADVGAEEAQDSRRQEQAVIGYLAAEAAEDRQNEHLGR